MNLYKKSGIFAIALLAFSSCAVHDLFEENLELGQVLPTVTWELGSSVCRAGSDVTFLGKYYTTNTDVEISHSEVWAMVTRSQSAAATLRLTSSLSYTKTVTSSDTVRSSQLIQSYDHSLATWNGYEYELNASFPTSQTLIPVSWVNPAEFDSERFDLYYPETFKAEFNETVVNYLTADSTYYNDLRHVYCNYDFTAEQFQTISANNGVTFPTETATDMKSDLWYTNLENLVTTTTQSMKTVLQLRTKWLRSKMCRPNIPVMRYMNQALGCSAAIPMIPVAQSIRFVMLTNRSSRNSWSKFRSRIGFSIQSTMFIQ